MPNEEKLAYFNTAVKGLESDEVRLGGIFSCGEDIVAQINTRSEHTQFFRTSDAQVSIVLAHTKLKWEVQAEQSAQKKEDLNATAWLKDVAPSPELRKWFNHDSGKWTEFKKRYRAELDKAPEAWEPLLSAARRGTVTLLYSAHDTEHNSALLLQNYLEARLSPKSRSRADAG